MADYGAAGVWDHDGAPLDPAKLPLSPKLRARLARWSARFEKSFEGEIDLDAFAAEGRAIARAVKPSCRTGRSSTSRSRGGRAGYRGARSAYEIGIP